MLRRAENSPGTEATGSIEAHAHARGFRVQQSSLSRTPRQRARSLLLSGTLDEYDVSIVSSYSPMLAFPAGIIRRTA